MSAQQSNNSASVNLVNACILVHFQIIRELIAAAQYDGA